MIPVACLLLIFGVNKINDPVVMEIAINAKLFFPVNSPSQFYKDVLELGELAKLGERLLSHLTSDAYFLVYSIARNAIPPGLKNCILFLPFLIY